MNILEKRDKLHYGGKTWDEIWSEIIHISNTHNVELLFCQSNYEGKIVDFIQENMENINSIILNPAGLSNCGYSILDAIEAANVPFVEIHLSNIYARGKRHSKSIFRKEAIGQIVGFKENSYKLALLALMDYMNKDNTLKGV